MSKTGPGITSISPSTGGIAGGTVVAIVGSGFKNTSTVTVGGTNASVTYTDQSHISITTPAKIIGTAAEIIVTTDGNASAGNPTFTYVPTVTSLSVTLGSQNGGYLTTITGTGFSGSSTVTIGGNAANVTMESGGTSLSVEVPATGGDTPGACNVQVTTAGVSSAANTLFTYNPRPVVNGLNPIIGTTAGSTSVLISGTGFTGATAVQFGTETAAFTPLTDIAISATTPAGAAGTVTVYVTTPTGGTNLTSTLYTYLSPPSVNFTSPDSGPLDTADTGDNYPVTIVLTNPVANTVSGVLFGTAPVRRFTFVGGNNYQLLVLPPVATSQGQVTVFATNPAGTGPTTGTYMYKAPPFIGSIMPTAVSTSAPKTIITISGQYFTNTAQVNLIGYGGLAYSVIDDLTLSASITPSSTPAGTYPLQVVGSFSQQSTSGSFSLVPPPTITSINPIGGTTAGGTLLTIYGSSLTGTTGVTVSGAAATSLHITNSGQIEVNTPAGTRGPASVIVTTPYGSNAANQLYMYETAPGVTGISPGGGPLSGGITKITGYSFTTTTSVTFNSAPVTYTVISDTEIDVVVPASFGSSPNTVNVTVTTTVGSASTTYTYDNMLAAPSLISPYMSTAGIGPNYYNTLYWNPTGATDYHVLVVVEFSYPPPTTYFTVTDTLTGGYPPAGPPYNALVGTAITGTAPGYFEVYPINAGITGQVSRYNNTTGSILYLQP